MIKTDRSVPMSKCLFVYLLISCRLSSPTSKTCVSNVQMTIGKCAYFIDTNRMARTFQTYFGYFIQKCSNIKHHLYVTLTLMFTHVNGSLL